ncbi:hypothetical protein KGQ55_01805 [Patescibacteria group bacterium]|nr:hypothetical protein [Patescibacteria group bacterium]
MTSGHASLSGTADGRMSREAHIAKLASILEKQGNVTLSVLGRFLNGMPPDDIALDVSKTRQDVLGMLRRSLENCEIRMPPNEHDKRKLLEAFRSLPEDRQAKAGDPAESVGERKLRELATRIGNITDARMLRILRQWTEGTDDAFTRADQQLLLQAFDHLGFPLPVSKDDRVRTAAVFRTMPQDEPPMIVAKPATHDDDAKSEVVPLAGPASNPTEPDEEAADEATDETTAESGEETGEAEVPGKPDDAAIGSPPSPFVRETARRIGTLPELLRKLAVAVSHGGSDRQTAERLGWMSYKNVGVRKVELFGKLGLKHLAPNERLPILRGALLVAEHPDTMAPEDASAPTPKTDGAGSSADAFIPDEALVRMAAARIPALPPAQQKVLPLIVQGLSGDALRDALGYSSTMAADAKATRALNRLGLQREKYRPNVAAATIGAALMLCAERIVPAEAPDEDDGEDEALAQKPNGHDARAVPESFAPSRREPEEPCMAPLQGRDIPRNPAVAFTLPPDIKDEAPRMVFSAGNPPAFDEEEWRELVRLGYRPSPTGLAFVLADGRIITQLFFTRRK